MADLILSENFVFDLLESSERFPIDFDEAWQWVEYSKKGNAKRVLEKNFSEEIDYQVLRLEHSVNHEALSVQELAVLARAERIKLTVDCFEHFCLMANTDKAKQVRQHFIDCRRKYIKTLQERSQQVPQLTPIQLIAQIANQMADQERRQIEQEALILKQQNQINNLLEIQRQAEEELTALPYSEQAAPQKTTRIKINNLVRNYAQRTTLPHGKVWGKLYAEFRDRCHIDAKRRAENQGKKLAIEVIEDLGLIEELYAIASEILKD